MTMTVRITHCGPSNHECNVNLVVCEPNSLAYEKTIESHTLKIDESVDVMIYGSNRYINIIETAPREDT